MTTESVECQYCGTESSIPEDIMCKCGVMICTTQSLREQLRAYEAQITALRLGQSKVVEELCRRERVKNMKRDGFHVSNVAFWQNVIGRPAWSNRGKSQVRSRPAIDMSQFD